MMARARAAMISEGQTGDGLESVLYGMGINSETDALTMRNNAARQAWGYRNQSVAALYEGEVAAARASSEQWGDLLKGAGQIAAIGAGAMGKSPANGMDVYDESSGFNLTRGTMGG
jgi:hypothetical protein